MNDLLFWVGLVVFLYAYLGYPLLIELLSRLKPKEPAVRSGSGHPVEPAPQPDINIILCVHNAAPLIEQRIANLFELDYPTEKLQLIIVSDGSTDATDSLVKALDNPRITLLSYSGNRGKAYALSRALQYVSAPYVLFADVRQRFAADVITQILPYLRSADVGAVTGNLVIGDGKASPGLYWQYEKRIRLAESRFKTIVGVTGAIYMAKTALLPRELPEGLILDDMYIPLGMIDKGYQAKFCPAAIAYDMPSASLREEFDRKVRTLVGNYQLFRALPWSLNPLQNPAFFQLASHKLLRLLVPYCLLLLLVTSAISASAVLNSAFAIQLICYALALYGYFWRYQKKGQSTIALTFCLLNLAALKASWVSSRNPGTLWKRH